MITLAFPLWLLSKDKTLNILIVNNSAGLSEKFGIQLREYVKQIGPEFDLYLSDVKHSSTYLMFTDSQGKLYKGSIRLVGSSGSITGQDADYIILDDVYAGFDDITPSLLQKKIDWFKTIIEQRIEPHTKLVILHTRWHSEDLQGYLKDKYPDDYEFLEFPAIDENGQPLWPQRYTIDDYRKKQEAMGERQFQAIYQQQPLDLTSDFFYMDHLIFEDQFDDYAIAKCRSWDIASSDDKLGDQRDYTVGVRMCKTGNGQYWIFDYERGQYGNDVLHIIKQTAKLDTPNHKILLETGTKGGASGLLFNDYKKALNGYSTIQSDPTAMTKADRATPLRHAIYDGLVHVMIRNDNRRQAFIDEFKAFPNSKHDDIVDAVAHGFNYLKQFNGNSVKTGGTRRRRKIR
jgi:phage terminase large subunit-like protein